MTTAEAALQRYDAATAHLEPPFAVVDLVAYPTADLAALAALAGDPAATAAIT